MSLCVIPQWVFDCHISGRVEEPPCSGRVERTPMATRVETPNISATTPYRNQNREPAPTGAGQGSILGMDPNRLARGLGWFSIGLGLAEILAPRAVARTVGTRNHTGLMRF